MKKKIAMLTTAFTLTLAVAFANGNNNEVPNKVKADFGKHFTDAKNINWEKENTYYKVSFVLQGAAFFAYYSDDAHFIGVAHHILSDKLPMMLQADLKRNYAGYWITDLSEYTVNHEPGYSVTLENADQKIILKSNSLSNWQVDKKVKKD
jgi:hypothetical protein